MKMRKLILLGCGIFLILTDSVSAAIITYNNRTLWEAEVGGIAYSENFESYVEDTSFANTTVDVGLFSLTSINRNPNRNLIDVAPTSVPVSFGNVSANMSVRRPQQVTMEFKKGVYSFFSDFLYAGNGNSELTLELSTGDLTYVPGPDSALESFGFISTDLVNSILFKNNTNDVFYIDNIAVGVSPVPIPGAFWLLGSGLLGFIGANRRKN